MGQFFNKILNLRIFNELKKEATADNIYDLCKEENINNKTDPYTYGYLMGYYSTYDKYKGKINESLDFLNGEYNKLKLRKENGKKVTEADFLYREGQIQAIKDRIDFFAKYKANSKNFVRFLKKDAKLKRQEINGYYDSIIKNNEAFKDNENYSEALSYLSNFRKTLNQNALYCVNKKGEFYLVDNKNEDKFKKEIDYLKKSENLSDNDFKKFGSNDESEMLKEDLAILNNYLDTHNFVDDRSLYANINAYKNRLNKELKYK